MNKNITILYVDDEPFNLMLFEAGFKKNYNIVTARSGIEGLQILSENRDISVVISDMRMPEMTGIEFIRQAKLHYPNIVYFILTGFEINEEIARALDEKLILQYFRKPFDVNEIEKTIQEVFH